MDVAPQLRFVGGCSFVQKHHLLTLGMASQVDEEFVFFNTSVKTLLKHALRCMYSEIPAFLVVFRRLVVHPVN